MFVLDVSQIIVLPGEPFPASWEGTNETVFFVLIVCFSVAHQVFRACKSHMTHVTFVFFLVVFGVSAIIISVQVRKRETTWLHNERTWHSCA